MLFPGRAGGMDPSPSVSCCPCSSPGDPTRSISWSPAHCEGDVSLSPRVLLCSSGSGGWLGFVFRGFLREKALFSPQILAHFVPAPAFAVWIRPRLIRGDKGWQ